MPIREGEIGQPGELLRFARDQRGPMGEGDACDEIVQRADGETPPFQLCARRLAGCVDLAMPTSISYRDTDDIAMSAGGVPKRCSATLPRPLKK